jgi:hypothetical protein
MQIHRQTSDFGPLSRQLDRTTSTRSNGFDAILARESSITRQDLGAMGSERQSFGAPAAAGRGDDGAGVVRRTNLNPALLSPFPVPSTPPTAPPASTPPPAASSAPPPASTTPPTPTPTTPPATTTPPAPAPQTTTDRHPAMAALRNALTAMGMPFAGIDMEYSEQVVGYPGGSYVNRLITVRGADGRTESFDADLTLKNPRIAAVDMANFMRVNG